MVNGKNGKSWFSPVLVDHRVNLKESEKLKKYFKRQDRAVEIVKSESGSRRSCYRNTGKWYRLLK